MFIACMRDEKIYHYYFDTLKKRFCKVSIAGVKKDVWITYEGIISNLKVGDKLEYLHKGVRGGDQILGGLVMSIEELKIDKTG
jgi:hypothetical protein